MSSVGNIAQKGRSPGSIASTCVVLFAGLLQGCSTYNKDHVKVGSIPDDYRTRHPIVVSENEVFEDLAISSKSGELSMRDRNLVRDFARRFKRSGARVARLVLPVGSPNEIAARRVSRQIAEEFKSVGVRSRSLKITSYHASQHGDAATIRMAFNAMSAQVASECGVWDEDLSGNGENKNYRNFGCATQNNLATIVANPSDLLGPRGESEIDATRRDAVIQEWREFGSVGLPDLLAD